MPPRKSVLPATRYILGELLKTPGGWVDAQPLRVRARDFAHPGQAHRRGLNQLRHSRRRYYKDLSEEEIQQLIEDEGVEPSELIRRGADASFTNTLNNQQTAQHIEVDKPSKGAAAVRVRLTEKGVRHWLPLLREELGEEVHEAVEDYLREKEECREARLYGKAEQDLLRLTKEYTSRHNHEGKRSYMSPKQYVTRAALILMPLMENGNGTSES